MSRQARIGWAIIAAFALLVHGWGEITRDTVALVACVVTAGVVVGTGIGARALRVGIGPTLVAQVVAGASCAGAVLVVALGPEGLVQAPMVFTDGLRAIQRGSAPLLPDLGVAFDLVVMCALLALLTDLLAATLERPAYVLLPLLGLFLVPALGLPGPVEFQHVVRFGIGLGLVLLAASPHASDPRRGVRALGWAGAAGVVTLALVGASAAGGFVPIAPARPFGQDQLQMTNPALDLKRNLTQGSTAPILSYTTDQPTGAYLRLATLTVFDHNGFALDAVRVSTGRLPAPPGLRNPGTPRRTQVRIGDFESEWLPVPYAPTELRASGWGWAQETLDVMALARPDRKTATRGTLYDVLSLDVRPTADEVRAASSTEFSGPPTLTQVPQQLPARIRTLAQQVTQGAPTAGAKALALEAFLRSDRFRYSTAQAEGDSMSTLDDFLFGSRSGYCEQYAGALVAMARTLGIPARLAVGFTPGTYANGTWEVTARDLHTWPELWLDGWGWVAFEPTPGSGVPTANLNPPTASPSPSVTTRATETPEPTANPSDDPGDETSTPTPTPETATTPVGGAGGTLAGVLGAILAAALLAVGPMTVRSWQRRARLAGTADPRATTLAAWDELRAEVADLGGAWPAGSPRYAAAALAEGLPTDAAAGVRALGVATERALFDDPDAYRGPGSWAVTVWTVERALRERATRGERVRATFWPRSLFGRR